MDRYQHLREMHFTVAAQALGIDMGKFRGRRGGTEFGGPCPVHAPKKNSTSFSYNVDGRYSCFSCGTKGRGAIDLAMPVRNCGFQAAVEMLEPFAGAGGFVVAPPAVSAVRLAHEQPAGGWGGGQGR